MSDELLPYYSQELAFIRRMGAQFAEANPKLAGELKLGPDSCEDPHVERMIMAFAYLTARIRRKLDDDFPELTNALLEVLYPHYLRPMPSASIVEFQLDRGQAGLVGGYTVGRGKEIETEPVKGEPCRFRTCYDVTLFPVEVKSARLVGARLPSPAAPQGAAAALQIGLQCVGKEMTFAKLTMPRLRFFLSGQTRHVFALYELIFNHALQVTLANAGRGDEEIVLGAESIAPVGFAADEGLVPYSARSFPGYRLLLEYFTFPEKFCFFDLVGLTPERLARLGNRIELCIHLDRSNTELQQNVGPDTFRLGCTPMVNLFELRAEPIRLTHTDYEYRVVPDARRPLAYEVYGVERVVGTSPSGAEVEYHPFYSFKHAGRREEQQTFWLAARRLPGHAHGDDDRGTEVCLSLVDLGFSTNAPPDWIVHVDTLCLNRDLPGRLPFGGGQPYLSLVEGGPIARIACVTPPTPTARPEFRSGALWRIISHLSLNHLSIASSDGSAEALREILKLYDFVDSPATRAKIDGVLGVGYRRAVSRLSGRWGSEFCRGVEIAVTFDEERFSDNSLFLFATVLERFVALYASVNSFTQFVAETKGAQGSVRKWPPRVGEHAVL